MKRFFGIFLSDGYKLAKMKSLYIGIAVMAVLVLVSALAVTGMAELYEEAYGENMIFGDGNGGIKEVDDIAAEIMLQDGLSMLATAPASSAVTTLVAIIAALFIGTDYSSGMMRLFVGRGAGKAQAFVSKWLWVLILTLVYTCISYLFCLIAAAALGADGKSLSEISGTVGAGFGTAVFYAFVFSAIFTAVPHFVRSKAGGITLLLAMEIVVGAILVAVLQLALGVGTGVESENAVYLLLDPYYAYEYIAATETMTGQELGLVFGGGAMWIVLFMGGGLLHSIKADIK